MARAFPVKDVASTMNSMRTTETTRVTGSRTICDSRCKVPVIQDNGQCLSTGFLATFQTHGVLRRWLATGTHSKGICDASWFNDPTHSNFEARDSQPPTAIHASKDLCRQS